MTTENNSSLFGGGAVVATNTGDDRPAVYIEDGVYVFRASSLKTEDCQLIRTLQGETPNAHSANTLAAFAAGHEWEPKIIERYEGMRDAKFTEDQKEVVLQVTSNIIVRGHIDGIIVDDDGTQTLGEVKCLAPTTMDSIRRAGTVGGAFGYDIQLSIYMHALGLPGEWVVGVKGWVDSKGQPVPWKDRSQFPDGEQVLTEIHTETVDEPPVKFGVIMRKLIGVVKAYEAAEDVACPNDTYGCRFWPRCDNVDEPETAVTIDGELAATIDSQATLLVEARAMKALWAEQEKETKAKLTELIGQEQRITTQSYVITNPQSKGRRTLDKKLLAEKLGDLSEYEKVGHPYHTMKVTEL